VVPEVFIATGLVVVYVLLGNGHTRTMDQDKVYDVYKLLRDAKMVNCSLFLCTVKIYIKTIQSKEYDTFNGIGENKQN
jgi:hypothetical protein